MRTATLAFLPITLLLAFTPAVLAQNRPKPEVTFGWFPASNGQVLPWTFVAGYNKSLPIYPCHADYLPQAVLNRIEDSMTPGDEEKRAGTPIVFE